MLVIEARALLGCIHFTVVLVSYYLNVAAIMVTLVPGKAGRCWGREDSKSSADLHFQN